MRWQILDWPPLASHALMFFVGCGVVGLNAPTPVITCPLSEGEVIYAPHRFLARDITRGEMSPASQLGIVLNLGDDIGMCRLISDEVTPIISDGSVKIRLKAQAFDRFLLELRRNHRHLSLQPYELTKQLRECSDSGIVVYEK